MTRWTKPSRTALLILGALTMVFGLALVAAIRFGLSTPGTSAETYQLPGLTVFQQNAPAPALIVTSVESGSEAEARQIHVGDQILAIDGHPVRSLDDIESMARKLDKNSLAVRLMHNETVKETTLIRGSGHRRGT